MFEVSILVMGLIIFQDKRKVRFGVVHVEVGHGS